MIRVTLVLLLSLLPQTSLIAELRPNVLLICIDDLRPELACFGKSYIRSPHIDRLAETGRAFERLLSVGEGQLSRPFSEDCTDFS